MISNRITKQIIERSNIVEVINEYVPLQKKGNSYKGICPFHHDTDPSMSVSSEKKVFNCFSCGTKGNIIYFVSRFENISMDQATIKLAQRLGIEVNDNQTAEAIHQERLFKATEAACQFYEFYLFNSEEGIIAQQYLVSRGLSEEIIHKFRIGLAPSAPNYLHLALNKKEISIIDQIELGLVHQNADHTVRDVFRNRIIFAICNNYGKVVGFSGRTYLDSNQAKYINSPENILFHKSNILYNFHNASAIARQKNKIYLFEGFMDVIAAERSKISNAVATMGTALTNEHIKMLTSLTKNITVCFDGDQAGINAMIRSNEMLASRKIIPEAILIPNNLDPDDYLNKHGENALRELLETSGTSSYHLLYQLAHSNLDLNNIDSIQTFKISVFNFLKNISDQTIIEYFLSKLAQDINVSIDIIRNDFKNNIRQIRYYNQESEIIVQENDVKQIQAIIAKRKQSKCPQKVVRAYNYILAECINSRDNFIDFRSIAEEPIVVYHEVLMNPFQMYLVIKDIYNRKMKLKRIDEDILLNELENTPNLIKYWQVISEQMRHTNIHNDKKQQEKYFNDCLYTVKEYLNKAIIDNTYNGVIDALNKSDQKELEKKAEEYLGINRMYKKVN